MLTTSPRHPAPMNFAAGIDLARLRHELVRIEDTIIFALIERAQFATNDAIYRPAAFPFNDRFQGSFLDRFLNDVESVHAKVRRYTSPDEYPFTSPLPDPILPPLEFPRILAQNTVNLNHKLMDMYINEIVPKICTIGDDGNYGSSATKDVEALQILSRRVHYGKFVAEAKFNDPKQHDEYVRLIQAKDRDGIMSLLTNVAVEERVLRRLRRKATIYGQEIDDEGNPETDHLRISPDLVANMYERFVIPLTKEVEVEYLLGRLNAADFQPTLSLT